MSRSVKLEIPLCKIPAAYFRVPLPSNNLTTKSYPDGYGECRLYDITNMRLIGKWELYFLRAKIHTTGLRTSDQNRKSMVKREFEHHTEAFVAGVTVSPIGTREARPSVSLHCRASTVYSPSKQGHQKKGDAIPTKPPTTQPYPNYTQRDFSTRVHSLPSPQPNPTTALLKDITGGDSAREMI
jgi:hypothetical protein